MKLITFDATNTLNYRRGEATIRFNKKGPNSISTEACKNLGLKDGDCIAIHQDDENPSDWYISADSNGFKLRLQSAQSKGLYFNSAAIANTILDALGVEEISKVFKMGEIVTVKKVNYYTIITAI